MDDYETMELLAETTHLVEVPTKEAWQKAIDLFNELVELLDDGDDADATNKSLAP